MDGLIESGHTWLVPLKDFRDQLFQTTIPENKDKYRNPKGRLGQVKVFFDESGKAKASPGPYRMEYRKSFLKKLLAIQHDIARNEKVGGLELISKAELEQIRVEWRRDPVEPQWDDPLPKLYAEVFGAEAVWDQTDDAAFSGTEMALLDHLEQTHGIPKELVMKLLELELSMEGLVRRSNLIARIGAILKEDWGGRASAVDAKSAVHARAEMRLTEIKELESLYRKWASQESHVN